MSKLRTYRVSYWIEQGYDVLVEARSPTRAQDRVKRMLDDKCDRLDNSKRVHHDGGVCDVDLDESG